MSSQSSPSSRPARRAAAAFGASAVLGLALAGPSMGVELPDPVTYPAASAAPQVCVYVGGASVVSCRDQSSTSPGSGAGSATSAEGGTPQVAGPGSGAGSATSAERGTPQVAVPVPRGIVVPSPEPSDMPALGIGVAAAVVIAGGLLIASTNRRRPA